jgi:hypothetical protein
MRVINSLHFIKEIHITLEKQRTIIKIRIMEVVHATKVELILS